MLVPAYDMPGTSALGAEKEFVIIAVLTDGILAVRGRIKQGSRKGKAAYEITRQHVRVTRCQTLGNEAVFLQYRGRNTEREGPLNQARIENLSRRTPKENTRDKDIGVDNNAHVTCGARL